MLLKNNTSKLSNKADPISIETGIKLDNVDTYVQNKAPNIPQPQNLLKKILMFLLLYILTIAVCIFKVRPLLKRKRRHKLNNS